MGGRLECAQDVRIHRYGKVTVRHELLITRFDVLKDPVGKRLSYERVDQVYDPLAWKAAQVICFRQVLLGIGKLARLSQELFDTQPLVLGHREICDAVGVQEFLTA